MAMVMITDEAYSDPRLLACGELADEVFGLLVRAATWSGKHYTDGVFPGSMLATLNPLRWRTLVDLAVKNGIVHKLPRRDSWALVTGPDMFISVLSRAEVMWNRQRQADNSNPRLTMPVKARDGDGCRYCGIVVHWKARRGPRAGTYDHRRPPGPDGLVQPGKVEDSVVCCSGCNSSRGGHMAHGLSIAEIDALIPLRDEPFRPYYSEFTANQLSKYFGRPFAATKAADLESAAPPAHPGPSGPQEAAAVKRIASPPTGRERQPAAPQPTSTAGRERQPVAPPPWAHPGPTGPLDAADEQDSGDLGDSYAQPSAREQAPAPGITAGQGPPGSADRGRNLVSGQGREGEGRVGQPAPPPSRRRGSRGGKKRR